MCALVGFMMPPIAALVRQGEHDEDVMIMTLGYPLRKTLQWRRDDLWASWLILHGMVSTGRPDWFGRQGNAALRSV